MQHLDDGTLQAWLDRARSGMEETEREQIERHLANCPECSTRAEALDEMTTRFQSLLPALEPTAEQVPEWKHVVARARMHRDAGRRRPVWKAATWAAGVAAVMGLGWLSNDIYRSVETARLATPVAVVDSAMAPPSGVSVAAEAGVAEAPVVPEAPMDIVADAGPILRPATPVTTLPNPTITEAAIPQPAVAEPVVSERVVADVDVAPAVVDQPVVDGPVLGTATGPQVVHGRVTDESGRPLASAQVMVRGTGVGALTNRDGEFSLFLTEAQVDPEGRDLTITAQMIGYGAASRELAARLGDTVSADFELVQQAIALDELVVTATAGAVQRVVDTGLVARAVRLGNSVTGSAVLRTQPGDTTWGAPWAIVSRAQAEFRVGFPLLTVLDLPVLSIEVGTRDGEPVVRVTQEIEGGARLTLIEASSLMSLGVDAPSDPSAQSVATTRRGDVSIAAAAPIPAESLRSLLERLR